MKPNPDDTGRLKAFSGRGERRRFGRYETLFRIAAGGMAEVYAARIVGEGGFEKVVALKRMLPNLAEDERFVSMFLDEGRVAAHISSPNVVQTLDLGRADDDSLYLVMELVVGVPLGHLIRGVLKNGEYVDLHIAVEILAQAATGLHDAHEATTPMGDPLELIHRDISPQNILVDRTGRTRITDFGVARAMQSHSQTQTGEVKGKMSYFAPEQAKGGALTPRVDIFALGIVGWELITGRRLFKSDNPLNTLRKVTEEPIPTVHECRPGVPPELGACIAKALQRDPADRHESARAFAQALRAAIQPARQSDVGEYVKKHGQKSLAPLQDGLKRALSNEPDDEVTRVASPTASGSGISTSAIVPMGSAGAQSDSLSGNGSRSLALNAIDSAGLHPASAAPKPRGLLLGLLALAIASLCLLGAFFGLRSEPSSTALEPLQETTPAAVAAEPTTLVPENDSPAMAQPIVAPEPEPAPMTTMRTRPRGRRMSMATPPIAAVAVTSPSMETAPTTITPMVDATPEPTMATPMTIVAPPTTAMTTSTTTSMTTEMTTSMTTEMTTPPATGDSSETTSEMSDSSMGLLMQWGDP